MSWELISMLKFPQLTNKPSSLINPYYNHRSGRVHEFDPKAHEIVGETQDHYMYNCPFCLATRGREDHDGKFYWNYKKQIGYCFKCESIGILKTDVPYQQVLFENSINNLIESLSDNEEIVKSELNSLQEFDFAKLVTPLDSAGLDYISNRCILYPEMYKIFNMMSYSDKGMIVPIIINSKVYSYCLRFYNPTGKMKYYLPKVHKLLYSPMQIFNKCEHTNEITLVEGTFDAIACTIDGFKNPIALFGKSITPLQLYLLRKLSPDKINIYMDSTDLSLKVMNKLKGFLPTVSKYRVINSDGSDSEEKLNYKLVNYSEDYLERILTNLNELKKYYESERNNFINFY